MNAKKVKSIEAIRKIINAIDAVEFGDQEAWQGVRFELDAIVHNFPRNISVPLKTIGLCLEGVQAISAPGGALAFALIEAISNGLNAAQHYLLDNPDKKLVIQKAERQLKQVLAKTQTGTEEKTASETVQGNDLITVCPDDAAALLIQPEANDPPGPAGLNETLPQDPAAEDSSAAPGGQPEADNSEHDYMPQDPDAELLGEFIAESSELIVGAEEALLTLETDPDDVEAVGMVFRAFHTVKGTAAFMDLTLISELGHHAESLLSRVRDGEIHYGGGYADLALRALDMIKDLIHAVEKALGGSRLTKPDGYDDLMGILVDPEAAGISSELDEVAVPRLGDVLVAQGKVERKQVEQTAQRHPDEKIGAAMVKDKTASAADVGRALRTQKRLQGSGPAVESSVRVSTQRLDRLIDMVGELVIAHSMVAQDEAVINGDHHKLLKKISHAGKIVRELQGLSMSMRMVPLKASFNKMARLVRDLSRKVGKQIIFETEGEDTEIDRNLVDVINDPLVHMVRNAVDHGIELPELRVKNGKPEFGTVKLSACHAAGNVVVEIKDDGKGLDREAILAKAKQRGLIDEGSPAGDREVFNLIFEPGFSTAQTVTDVSGRGVGMDVVRKNIESLRGQTEIKSEPGKGSVFKMSLPLTLAIIDGMVVRVGPEAYIIPTVSIIRSIKPAPGDIATVHQQGEVLALRGELIPLFRLADLYHIDVAKQNQNEQIVVVVEDEERPAGLIVDELIGRQQVVIKTLGETMNAIPGIAGGAIMPSGRVGLIVDVGSLVRFANTGHGEGATEEHEICC